MKTATDLLILGNKQVADILEGQELKVIDTVRNTYIQHADGQTSVPYSTFLRFPDKPSDRIIGLPAYVAGTHPVAGLKWVASFPENLSKGLDRASAMLVLNSLETGRPYSIMEASLINMERTAASAALAATLLTRGHPDELTLIGCGPINRTICRFILASNPSIHKISVYDVDKERATALANYLQNEFQVIVTVAGDISSALAEKLLVSFATNAPSPSLNDISLLSPNALVLHISLRDLGPEIIQSAYNVVDDTDHVNREQTSIHLTSQKVGNTSFVNASIGEIARDGVKLSEINKPIIFSPFGLGALDVKLAQYIYGEAIKRDLGTAIANFLPAGH